MSDTAMDTDQLSNESSEQTIRSPLWLIPALLIVGILLGLAGEAIVASVATNRTIIEEGRYQRLFYPEPHGQLGDPPEWLIEVRNSMMANDAIGYAGFFAVLLGVIGLVIGVACSKPLRGLLIGIVAGALAGGVGGAVCYYLEWELFQIDMEGAIKASLVLGLLFLGCGISGAFVAACTGPSRSISTTLVNGIIGAVLALIVYLLISIAAFPIGFPESTFPYDPGVRYTLFACLGLSPAIAAALMLRPEKAKVADAAA